MRIVSTNRNWIALSVSAIFDSALFKVFDGLTQRFAAAAGLVPSSVPRLA
jgi:hypothetical protein